MRRPDWQLSRNGLFWVLFAFAAVVALHVDHLPAWITALAGLTIAWRILEYRGAVPFPPWPLKAILVAGCVAGLTMTYPSLLGLEPMLAMLIAGFGLKLLEMHHKRDAVVLIYLAFFTAAADCVFTQEILNFCMVLLTFVIAATALVSINRSRDRGFSARPAVFALKMLATALPLMLALFLVVPRLGALWSIPGPKNQARTGVSDVMSPGDFSRLSRSDALAFRVRFDGEIPPRSKLYWRGLVFSQFDGRQWSQADFFGPDQPIVVGGTETEGIERRGDPLRYSLTVEPTHSHWLFALSTPATAEPGIRLMRDSRLVSVNEISLKRSFEIRSWLDYRLQPDGLHPHREALEKELPPDSNPETVQIARQWASETPDPEALIARVLQLYNRSFVYTLEPPQLGTHTVDEFLWRTRNGFCEHFAGSFAFFMRAAGYPARVIGGYLGGEVHPTENFVTVRQYDAHAWAEVWLEGRGWVRVDPTAAVAPERVEMSVADLFAGDDWFLADSPLSLVRFRHFGLVNWMVLRLDYIDYAWGTWVLGYDKRQLAFLQSLLGQVTAARLGLLFAIAAGVSLLPYLVVRLLNRRRDKADPRDALIRLFCAKMARAGLPRRTGEGIQDFAHRVAAQRPDLAAEALAIADAYVTQRYDVRAVQRIDVLRRRVRRLSAS
ncbi:MAG: transglutaminaseTgpA domain-containing protein [Lysobacterales bacterium]